MAGCGQKEASDTLESMKQLPVDVYHELLVAMLDHEM
jgi:hypothetical protein